MKKFLALLLVLMFADVAHGQISPGSGVQQAGTVTAGDAATWTRNGVIQDGGGAPCISGLANCNASPFTVTPTGGTSSETLAIQAGTALNSQAVAAQCNGFTGTGGSATSGASLYYLGTNVPSSGNYPASFVGYTLVVATAGASSNNTFVASITAQGSNYVSISPTTFPNTVPDWYQATVTPSGGTGYVVGERVVGSDGATYQVVKQSGGVPSQMAVYSQNVQASSPGANPVTVTQSSTSGVGTGVSLAVNYTAAGSTFWIVNPGDGANINTGLTNLAAAHLYNGSAVASTLKVGGPVCGTTVTISNPGGVVLEGPDKGGAMIVAAGTISGPVYDRSTNFAIGGGLKNITIEAAELATTACEIEGGEANILDNVYCKDGTTNQLIAGNGTTSTYENHINRSKFFTDFNEFPIVQFNPAKDINVQSGFTDSYFVDDVANWATVSSQNTGYAGIHWEGFHPYGYPYGAANGNIGLYLTGFNVVHGTQCDGELVDCIYVAGGNSVITGTIVQCDHMIGQSMVGIEIASGVNNAFIEQPANNCSTMPAQALVVQDGTPGAGTTVIGNTPGAYSTGVGTIAGQVYLSLSVPNPATSGLTTSYLGTLSGVTSGSTASGATSIVLTATGYIAAGMYSLGNTSIPDGDTVLGNSSGTLTLSQPTTGTISTTTTLNFYSPAVLMPENGDLLTINGVNTQIPSTGVFGSAAGLSPWGNLYRFYASNQFFTVSGAVANGSNVKLTLSAETGLVSYDTLNCVGIQGVPGANGAFQVTIIDSTHVVLQNSTFNTGDSYVTGGECYGTVIQPSTTTHVTATNGVEVKSGDATQTLVGLVDMQASGGNMRDSSTQRYFNSWFNRKPKLLSRYPGGAYTWSNNATTFIAPSTPVEAYMALFGSPGNGGSISLPLRWRENVNVANSLLGATLGLGICFNTAGLSGGSACTASGSVLASETATPTQAVANYTNFIPLSGTYLKPVSADGYLDADMVGYCSGATCTSTLNSSTSIMEVEILQ